MNIHEYQAKELLAKFGVPVPAGFAALTVEEAVEASKKLPGPLYVVKAQLPELTWGPAVDKARMDLGFHSKEERRRFIKTGVCQRLSKRQRLLTPLAFRDLLLSIARTAHRKAA